MEFSHHTRILFILKKRQEYEKKHSHIGLSTGLYNSAFFVHEMLEEHGIQSKLVIVDDNNDIDREVHKYKPTHVIIEALWVVPHKFNVLCKLHPHVKWIIRLHSQLPFIANEGIAMEWIGEYAEFRNLTVAVNSNRMLNDIRFYLQTKMKWSDEKTNDKVILLPNYFPIQNDSHYHDIDKKNINIGCFGSVRPLKNQLIQAMGAIRFAEQNDKHLRFHINAERIEQKGEPILKNLISLFDQLKNNKHKLITHSWMPRKEFLELCNKMDIGMQCSFSETFNIVSADLISVGVPIIGSKEIPWLVKSYITDSTDSDDIVKKLNLAYKHPKHNVSLNKKSLEKYSKKSSDIWLTYFQNHNCHN